MISLTSAELENIIKLVISATERNNSWEAIIDLENSLEESKLEISNYLQLPDLFKGHV